MILLAIFVPPLYFLLAKKMGLFVVTSAMFVAAIILAITVVLIPGSFILWFIASFMAARHYRRREMNSVMNTHADLIATKMAEKFPASSTQP